MEKPVNTYKKENQKYFYPFYAVFRCDDGHYDWGFFPAKTRNEASNKAVSAGVDSGATVVGIHLVKTGDYISPYDYKDEDGIRPMMHECIEELDKWCEDLTAKDNLLDEALSTVM